MLEIYLGSDPGARGAICALAPEINRAEFIDLSQTIVKVCRWILNIKEAGKINAIFVEDVHALGNSAAKATFTFGRNVQKVHDAYEIVGLKFDLITPQKWQPLVGVTAKGKDAVKQNVAELCEYHYPGCAIRGKRGGLIDGRSDSLMLAHAAYLLHQSFYKPYKPKESYENNRRAC